MEQINFTKNLNEMEEDKYELYDRNIRLWGKENQQKLSSSCVLLINLNTVITELAKNLLLSGININLYDKCEHQSEGESQNKLVSEQDVNNNYFLNNSHIGEERVKVLAESLGAINKFATIKEIQNFRDIIAGEIQCVCIGFSTFEKLKIYEEYFTKINIPVYSINTSGSKAFFYNNFSKSNTTLNASNQNSSENLNKQNEDKYVIVEFSKQAHSFIQNLKSANKKKVLRHNLFTIISLLLIFSRKNDSDSSENILNYDIMLKFSQNFLNENNLDYLSTNQDFLKILREIIDNFNVEFNAISSVIGGIVSQEVLKILTSSTEAFQGIYAYDSETQLGHFINPISF